MKQFRCVAHNLIVQKGKSTVEAAHALGMKPHKLWRLIDPRDPAIPFAKARVEYLLIAGYLRCSVHDLFEPIEPTTTP